MTEQSKRSILLDGLWQNNSGLVQLLGLCPLLAVTTTLAYGLGLGIATTFVLMCSNGLISLTRKITDRHIRIPVYVLIIAGLVTAVDVLMSAWFFDLHRTLGLFVPLIVTNCAIIARAEVFASKNRVDYAVLDGLAHGVGFALVLTAMGFLREIIGAGTLFANMDILFGPTASSWQMQLYDGFLLAILPPGAFLIMAVLVAAHRAITMRRTNPAHTSQDVGENAQEKTIPQPITDTANVTLGSVPTEAS